MIFWLLLFKVNFTYGLVFATLSIMYYHYFLELNAVFVP